VSTTTHSADLADMIKEAVLRRKITVSFTDHGHTVEAKVGKSQCSTGTGSTPEEALAAAVAGLHT
jgi:organic hydroperoxide reductase OsmC/OhrA